MILPQTLPLTFQCLAVYFRYPPYGSGQTVTKCRPKDTEGDHCLVPSFVQFLAINASQNDKTNAIETTYIFRGFASHIRHLNGSEWRKNTPNEQRKQKMWWAETRHETKRHSACSSFLSRPRPRDICTSIATMSRRGVKENCHFSAFFKGKRKLV